MKINLKDLFGGLVCASGNLTFQIPCLIMSMYMLITYENLEDEVSAELEQKLLWRFCGIHGFYILLFILFNILKRFNSKVLSFTLLLIMVLAYQGMTLNALIYFYEENIKISTITTQYLYWIYFEICLYFFNLGATSLDLFIISFFNILDKKDQNEQERINPAINSENVAPQLPVADQNLNEVNDQQNTSQIQRDALAQIRQQYFGMGDFLTYHKDTQEVRVFFMLFFSLTITTIIIEKYNSSLSLSDEILLTIFGVPWLLLYIIDLISNSLSSSENDSQQNQNNQRQDQEQPQVQVVEGQQVQLNQPLIDQNQLPQNNNQSAPKTSLNTILLKLTIVCIGLIVLSWLTTLSLQFINGDDSDDQQENVQAKSHNITLVFTVFILLYIVGFAILSTFMCFLGDSKPSLEINRNDAISNYTLYPDETNTLNDDFYSMAFMAFVYDDVYTREKILMKDENDPLNPNRAGARPHFLPEENLGNMFKNCIIISFMQLCLILLIYFNFSNEGGVVEKDITLSILVTRLLSAIILHQMIQPEIAQGIFILKFTYYESYNDRNMLCQYTIGLLAILGGVFAEVLNQLLICTYFDEKEIVMNLAAFAIIVNIDEYYAKSYNNNIYRHLIERSEFKINEDKNPLDNEEQRNFMTFAYWFIHKTTQAAYCGFYYYFFPFLVILLSMIS